MNLFIIIHFSLAYSIGTIAILLLVYWLVIISYRLYLIRSKHKQYLDASELDPRIRSQILYSLATVRNRDICLVVLILLEILIVTIFSYVMPELIMHIDFPNNKIMEILPNSTVTNLILYNLCIYPVYALLFVAVSIFVLTQLMLLSFLNSYLAGRCFGYSFPKTVVYKYMLSSIFQTFILTICIIPILQFIFLPICTLLLFLNWLNLIASSRKVCRAIRSKMKEIRLFEWNPAQYRNHSLNLKQYRIAMGFLISAFFFLTLALFLFAISYIVLLGSYFINTVYGINLHFNNAHVEVQEIRRFTILFINWAVYFFIITYAVLLFLPSLFMFLYHMANLLYDRCTGKGKFNNVLFEPLINH